MYKIPNNIGNKIFPSPKRNNAIINYFAIGLIAFGLLFIEQKVLKFFIFPLNVSTSLIVIRWYSLLIYIFIIIELIRRAKYHIKLGGSFIFLGFLYIIQFLSFIINVPITSFYAFITNYLFGYSIDVMLCILCYLYCSELLIKLLPPLIFFICTINLFFMLTPLDVLSGFRFLALGPLGSSYSLSTVGLYTYPTEVGILSAITVALAFSLESIILIIIISIIGLLSATLSLERAPLLGMVFILFPIIYFLKNRIRKPQNIFILLIFSLVIFIAYRQLPGYFYKAQSTLFARFQLGSYGSTDQNTLLGAWTPRNDMFSSWVNLTLESPFFGNGIEGVDEYMQESGLIGIGHNMFLNSSTRNGIIFAFFLIIICIRAIIGFWRVKRTRWGVAYFAAYLSVFPSLLIHALAPWLFWILLAIGMIIYDQNKTMLMRINS